MKRKIYLSGWIVLLCHTLYAVVPVKGKVMDVNRNAIEGVAVVLQTADSVYIDAVVTDEGGTFEFEVEEGNYRLYFQHLLYESFIHEIAGSEAGEVILKEKEYLLDNITVTAERPHVKVSGSTLIYDTPVLLENKAVTNAFELVKELPGVTGSNDDIKLLGASNLNIILNGQLTTLTLEQLVGLLKTMPASRVIRAEVMYNAPAKYNVKGALINVVTDENPQDENMFQGEVGANYEQKHYANGNTRANLMYSISGLSMDLLVEGKRKQNYMGEEMYALHTLDDDHVEINQFNRGNRKGWEGTARLGINYTLKNNDKLSGSYYINTVDSKSSRYSKSRFDYYNSAKDFSRYSTTTSDDNSRLQNAKLQYTGANEIVAGIDFTNYRNPDEQHFIDKGEGGNDTDIKYNTEQNISKWQAFINHSYSFKGGWQLNYGINGGYSVSNTNISYRYNTGSGFIPLPDKNSQNKQKEYSGSFFSELTHNFSEHFSATLSLKAEYFRSDYTSNGNKKTLWDEWALFPNASFNYTISPQHMLQLHIHSNKDYPSYWSVNPQVSYINSYTEIHGNPELKPSRSYEGQFLYILKQKYVFLLSQSYNPDHFLQLPYQQPGELKNVYRFENLDFSIQSAIGIILPVRFNKIFDSRFTLHGIRMQQKSDHFYDEPFNNKKYAGYIKADNTISFSDKIKLNVSGYYLSSAIQGVYRLGSLYDVSVALKWVFANNRGTLTFKYNNMFKSNIPRSIVVDTGNQYSRMKDIDDTRFVGVSFSWRFGGYKEKKQEKVDVSRFGK